MTARRSITRIKDADDVNAQSPANGDLLAYDTASSKWKNQSGGSQPDLVVPLNIPSPYQPTYPGMTHPSVVFAPNRWNGHFYWMAFTPLDGVADLENPCLVCSDDGVTWTVPAGLTNPLVSASVGGPTYNHNSDPNLLLSADGSTLILYFRAYSDPAPSNEGIYRMTSTDGVHWSAPTLTLTHTADTASHLLSPSVLIEADGSFSMWVVNDSAGITSANRINKYTSSDGLAWTGPTNCTSSDTNSVPWHIDVKRVGSTYYGLWPSLNPDLRMYFNVSTDAGITWTGSTVRVVEPSGFPFDARCNYKSCFVPVEGDGLLRFRTWLVGVDNTGSDPWTAVHRIAFYGDMDFLRGTSFKSMDRFLVAAPSFFTQLGTPNLALIDSRWPVWSLDSASSEAVATTVAIPSAWRQFQVKALWANGSSSSGNVDWSLAYFPTRQGFDMATGEATAQVTASQRGQNVMVQTTMATGIVGAEDVPWHFRITRRGAQADDTLANDAGFIGLMFERTA